MDLKQCGNTYIIIMNFSGIYNKENFYKNENIKWLDCSNIQGINCYCDKAAEKIIKDQIRNFPPEGIHFIDSGNFHYVSEFWMEKIDEKFNLIVFDHHSDMQKPSFGNFISCGSWVMNALERNKFLQKVILIGLGIEEQKLISPQYKDRIVCIDYNNFDFRNIRGDIEDEYPVYISVDKDVLSEEVIDTNWNQGDMKLDELEEVMHKIISHERVIGIDICGECSNRLDKLKDIEANNMTNLELLKFLKKEKVFEKEYALDI